MLGVIITLLLIVHIVVCLLMSVLVLMQRPRKDGLGAAFGGGMTDTMFGAQTTNVLQKGTVYLGGLFFAITLTLALLLAKQQRELSARDEAPFLGDEMIETETMPDEAGTDVPMEVDPLLPPPAAGEAPAEVESEPEPEPVESVEPDAEAGEPAGTDEAEGVEADQEG